MNWMIVVAAHCLCAMADEKDLKVPYEEDPKHYGEQHIQDMINTNGRIYVKSRSYNVMTKRRCYSIERQYEYGRREWVYTLRYRDPDRPNVLIAFNTTLRIKRTGNHSIENAAVYTFNKGFPGFTHKLMTFQYYYGCMILVVRTDSGKRGCELMQTADTVGTGVPPVCKRLYDRECWGDKVRLYMKRCESLPDYIIPR
uniref:Lipocalin n=1 Tax=Rhipicephalus zambeziensis TaxID=60191 RepID=A0A224YDH9_9ACAR